MDKPITPKKEFKEVLHGVKISDPYRWLEDVDSQKTRSWLESQDAYTESIINSLPSREGLLKEFQKLYRQDSTPFPNPRAGRYFFMKRKAEENHASLYFKEGLDDQPQLLVDPNKLSKEQGHPVAITGYNVSKDAKFITYTLSESSNDQSSLYVMDIDNRKTLEDRIPADLYPRNGSWSMDNSGFWYTRRMENVPTGEEKFYRKVYYHRLNTSYTEDEMVYGKDLAKEDSPGVFCSMDGRCLVVHVSISSEERERTEIYIRDLEKGEKEFRPVIKSVRGESDIYFKGIPHRGYFYLQTSYQAPWGKIQRIKLNDLENGSEEWETVVPEVKGRNIEEFETVQDRMFVLTLENVHSSLREYFIDGKFIGDIDFPGIGTCMRMAAEPEGSEIFYSFNSFAYPFTVFRIDINSGGTAVIEQQKVNFDLQSLETEQVWFISRDKTRVPMFLIHKRNLRKDGFNPTVLYGYGGFNISLTPSFNKSIIPFIERGGVYAIANIRGGGEFGEEWHKAGTKKQKQNTFDDFISAAKWLIDNHYTDSDHLAVSGASNGGLLVGAFMTQEPKLAKAVIMGVPVADMLRYHLFHGGRHWIPDYGSAEDPDIFTYLLKYSPYHNVSDNIEYPATLIITGDKDDRVHPGQAFKITARLQEVNKNNPIILRVERKDRKSCRSWRSFGHLSINRESSRRMEFYLLAARG
ncbi:MAG: prolyl oligopeptidase family serine peptidase [Patescibacteria group bacterium]|nr:prolyl oligopeptidase family serine peptidase [Patescibacteria group bacterium]